MSKGKTENSLSLSHSLSLSPSLTLSLQKSFLFLVCVRVSCPKDHSSFSSSLHQHIYPFKLHFPFPKQRFISQFLSQILLFTYFLLGGKQVSFHHLPCLASNPFIIDHMFIHSLRVSPMGCSTSQKSFIVFKTRCKILT